MKKAIAERLSYSIARRQTRSDFMGSFAEQRSAVVKTVLQ